MRAHLRRVVVSIGMAGGLAIPAQVAGGQELPFLSPCIEVPASATWVRDTVIGSASLPQLGAVTVLDLEDGVARRMPTFGPISIGKGTVDFHATAMASLLVDSLVGLVAGVKAITVRSVGFGDGTDANIARQLQAIARSVGITSANGDTSGPFRRVVVAMPVGVDAPFPKTRTWVRAGLRSGRMLTVAASGNEHRTQVLSPAAFPEAVAVGASTEAGEVWSEPDAGHGTNVGPELDVLAPGCQVVVTVDPRDIPKDRVAGPGTQKRFPDRKPPKGYFIVDGTSEATMIAAAVAARIWAAHPSMHAVQVRRALERSGGESHSDTRGFGVVNLGRVPLDTTPPSIRLLANRSTLSITISDNPAPALLGSDGIDGTFPESGIAAVAFAPSASGPWTVVKPELQGTAFFDRSTRCQTICTRTIPKGTASMVVRAIDSAEFTRLGGVWTGVEGTFGEATWRLTGPPIPTTTVAPADPGPTPTPTTGTPGSPAPVESADYRAYRLSFGEFVPQLESAIDGVRTVLAPERPIDGLAASGFAQMVQPSVNRICAVADAITARSWKSPARPPSMPDPWKLQFHCIANLTGSGLPYANTFGKRGSPIGDHPCYREFFTEWDTNVVILKAFVAGTSLPEPFVRKGC